MGVPIPRTGREAERLPERMCIAAAGVDRNGLAGQAWRLKQDGGQSPRNPTPAECRADVEASHTQGARHDGVKRQASDTRERAGHPRRKQSLARAVEPCRVGRPFGSEPIEGSVSLGSRLGMEAVESDRQRPGHDVD